MFLPIKTLNFFIWSNAQLFTPENLQIEKHSSCKSLNFCIFFPLYFLTVIFTLVTSWRLPTPNPLPFNLSPVPFSFVSPLSFLFHGNQLSWIVYSLWCPRQHIDRGRERERERERDFLKLCSFSRTYKNYSLFFNYFS